MEIQPLDQETGQSKGIIALDNMECTFTSDNAVKIKYHTEDGVKIKTIDFEQFCKAILDARDNVKVDNPDHRDSVLFSTGLLPSNVDIGVSVLAHKELKSGANWYVLSCEARKAEYNYLEETYKEVGIPKFLMAVKVAREMVNVSYVVAVRDKIITEDTTIYYWPFSNCYQWFGRVCFGGNRLSDFKIEKPWQLHSFPNMFLEMIKNDDSYGNNNSKLKHKQLLEELSGRPFPNEWLRSTEKTFTDFLEELK